MAEETKKKHRQALKTLEKGVAILEAVPANAKAGALRRFIHQKFEEAGLTAEFLIQKLKDGLEATETWRHADRNGGVIQRTSPDYAIRQKYLDMAFRIREAFPLQEASTQQAALIVQLPVAPSTTVEEWNTMMREMGARSNLLALKPMPRKEHVNAAAPQEKRQEKE